ncbi:hypothetical protein AADZ90_011965 [Aestuariibius sp. 2305UL40-4]|uniref:hypothetical protein n=1 Tax=Aestuariibius violaceus TaxID=3234132 RepID=UPI00345E590C
MSDPRGTAEIEEVLSSVRKLVSNEDRPARKGLDTAQTAQLGRLVLTPADAVPEKAKDDTPATGRLVLTPALRVTDKPAEPTATEAEPPAIDAELPPVEPKPLVLDSVAALRAMTAGPVEEAPQAPKVQPEVLNALDTKIAELEAAIARQKGRQAPAEGAAPVTPAVAEEAAPAEAAPEPQDAPREPSAPETGSLQSPPVFAHRPEPAEDAHAEDPAAEAEEPEIAIGADLEEAEEPEMPERRAQEVGLRLVPSAADEAETEEDDPWAATAGDDETPSDEEELDRQDSLQDDLTLIMGDSGKIDEEVLRRVITEIVHEELQGALGERITRNVRKLVRREIFRVLASQDLD